MAAGGNARCLMPGAWRVYTLVPAWQCQQMGDHHRHLTTSAPVCCHPARDLTVVGGGCLAGEVHARQAAADLLPLLAGRDCLVATALHHRPESLPQIGRHEHAWEYISFHSSIQGTPCRESEPCRTRSACTPATMATTAFRLANLLEAEKWRSSPLLARRLPAVASINDSTLPSPHTGLAPCAQRLAP